MTKIEISGFRNTLKSAVPLRDFCVETGFSRHGTLLATAETFVTKAPAGYFAFELENILHAPVKEPLLRLVEQDRIARQTATTSGSDAHQPGPNPGADLRNRFPSGVV